MESQSKEQKKTVERVMRAFKHGNLESSTGTKVEKRQQAIAIALHEAGASKYESDEENQENLRRTKQRERRDKAGADPAKKEGEDSSSNSLNSKQELYNEAKARNIEGRSTMNKDQLARAISKEGG